jgi:epoxide hydrolase 4
MGHCAVAPIVRGRLLRSAADFLIVRFVNMKTLRVQTAAHVALHVAVAGDGPPLLLLHGFPDNGGLWLPLLPALAAHHRLWMPDLRGYRHSDKPAASSDYAITHLVADVLALVDAMAGCTRGRVSIAGQDWGGILAWAFAALRPERVDRLLIFNAPHPCRFAQLLRHDAAQRQASAYVQRLRAPEAAALLAANGHARLRGLMQSALPQLPAAELESLAAGWAMPGALQAMLNWYVALDIDGADSVPALGAGRGRIEAPTLLLWGEQEGAFVPENLTGLDQWVPRLRIQRFSGAGHWLPREAPAAVAAAMRAFLAEPR